MKSEYSYFRQGTVAITSFASQFLSTIVALVCFVVLFDGIAMAQTHERPAKEWEDFNPNNFSNPTKIDNPWLPLNPGKTLVHEGSTNEDGERIPHRIEFTVTDLTKVIMGVRTVVVWIMDTSDGEMVEKEIAFYAQDNDGNVWYLGEYPESYEDGKLVEAPSWIAGIQDARPGIAMQAEPKVGTPSYSQGWGPAVDWTDRAQVYKVGEENCVPVDCYKDVLIMDEFNYKEPGFKLKYYARGVGHIRVGWRGDEPQQESLELTKFEQLGPKELADVRKNALALEKDAYKNSKGAYSKSQPIEHMSGSN